ncbi:ribosome-releasing factor 2, mitochondrial isoform X1 [Patella vulgata]|uniref:ribosome-releasing factor 2, mitochondrial isoform X1 n=1 Tax=Patella vulgata TaxID=6465 RepID=UPI00217F92F8|nr:ribosome-releasing factor 2, mitochondrial isoform X1 [Patella vulgata]
MKICGLSTILRCFHQMPRHYCQNKIQMRHLANNKSSTKRKGVHTTRVPAEKEDMSLIRNIGILAHIDAGKTTTTERMLYYTGLSTHLGEVHHGDTVMDYMEQERVRGITISSAAITLHWNKYKINLIDTPGHVDFTVEVERCLRVLDGAVVVLDSSAGVEAQTKTVWRQADKYSIPRIVYLNKMDKPGASIEKCLTSLKEKLNVEPLLLHLPVGKEVDFAGIVDLVTLKKFVWNLEKSPDGRTFSTENLTAADTSVDYHDILQARTSLIGQLSEYDGELGEMILSYKKIKDIPANAISKAVRKVTIDQNCVPVFCGSSLKNKAVQPLMDAVTHYLPSPLDSTYSFADFYGSDLCALAFKIIHDKQRGALTFLRLYSGSLKSGESSYNVNRECTEKTSRLLHVYANEYHDTNKVTAGNIACVSGLKEIITGDTLTNSKSTALAAATKYHTKMNMEADNNNNNLAILAGFEVPSPVFFCSIEPPSLAAQKHLDNALYCLQREDPSLTVEVNEETGQTILMGMGELHLDIIKQRILEEYRIAVDIGPPQVAYRETIACNAELEENLDKIIGGKEQNVTMMLSIKQDGSTPKFKHVKLEFSHAKPLHRHIKKDQLAALNNGVKSALMCGTLLNFPVTDVCVELHSFTAGYNTSSAMISACASQCIHKLLKQSDPVLLEPMMALTITTNEDRLHGVLGDLTKRRSHIRNVEATDNDKIIEAVTPLAELMGYCTTLRTITSGTATFSMEFSHYEKMTLHDQNLVVKKLTGFMPLKL